MTNPPTPRDLTGADLVLSHFSLDRNHPIEDRVKAVGSAGVAGIGLYVGQYRKLLASGWSDARLAGLLASHRVCLAEVEVLAGWAAHSPSAAYWETETLAWDMVDAFESRYVQAIGPYEGTIEDAAARFGTLCDRAAEHGAVVGLEFLPFTNIVTASDALRIVEAAGRPNGGVCVDIWHHERGAADLELIRAIPTELVKGIQMSDGPAAPTLADYRDDCLRNRVAPGDGDFLVDEFVSVLVSKGVDVPWSLEVCNDDVWDQPASEHVHHVATRMRDSLIRVAARP
jgi:sugar phosphate isomerase/epimerase